MTTEREFLLQISFLDEMAQEGEEKYVKQHGQYKEFTEAYMIFSSVIAYNPIGATAVIIDMNDNRIICQASTAPDDDSETSNAIIASLDRYRATVEEIRKLEQEQAQANDSQTVS